MTQLSDNTARERLRKTADQLFMIIGMGRSGTSLLQAMLSSHPDVMIPNETQFYTVIVPRMRPPRDLCDPTTFRRAIEYVLQTRQVRQMELDHGLFRTLSAAGPAGWDTIFLALLSAYAMKYDVARVGEKSPGHLLHVERLTKAAPNARFIQMVRDPRGMINSLRRAPFGSRSVMFGINSWRRSYTLQEHWHETLGATRSQIVTYESLVQEPQATLERICSFLDLPFDSWMLAHDQRDVAGFGSWQQEHMKNTLKPVFTSSIERWREQMKPAQIAMVESELGPQMDRLGYSLSHPCVRALALRKIGSSLLGHGHRIYNQARRRLKPEAL